MNFARPSVAASGFGVPYYPRNGIRLIRRDYSSYREVISVQEVRKSKSAILYIPSIHLSIGIMKPGQLLILVIAFALILSLAIVMLKGDVLTQDYEYKPPAYLSVREVDVKPIVVTGADVEVNVTAYINHGGGKSRNASMLLRAISSETGLLAAQASAPIPEAPETTVEKTLVVSQRLKMERNSGYDLKMIIFDTGSISDSGSVSIRGLNALTPESKRTGITLEKIDFLVIGVSAGRVSIRLDIYLENRGAEPSENLKLIVKARQADSNLLADKKSSETGVIANESTAVKSVQLDVPDGYNYIAEVELWRGDVLINTWEKPVLLAPTKTVPKESVEKPVKIEISKFVREEGVPGKEEFPVPVPIPTPVPMEPGFEVLAAITSLILIVALRRRLKW